jgi:hypothetical protein
MRPANLRTETRSLVVSVVCALACACALGCAASRGADPAPARAAAPYPVTLAASEERLKASRAAWTRLLTETGASDAPAPDLHPITATLRALPQPLPASLILPRVGGEGGKGPTDEETREALRRFLADAAPVLGVLPAELSLVSDEEAGGGLKRAVYRQQPFEYPLRGDYGVVQITFAADRRVVQLTSTAIPDSERLRRALSAAPVERLTAERAAAAVAGRAVTYTDAAGNTQTRAIAPQGEAAARELVVFPIVSETDPTTLELRIAWEVAVGGSPPLYVYVDAVTGQQLAARVATT